MPRPVGHNLLETFMKTLSVNAGLSSTDYTNHSICHTCITTLDTEGFEASHIVAISGHKSESTIREYSIKCPENKCKQMYSTLVDKMVPPKKAKCETIVRSEDEAIPPSIPLANSSKTTDQNVTLTLNNSDIQQLKTENFDLLELTDTSDDDLLAKYLDDNDLLIQQQAVSPPNENQIQATTPATISTPTAQEFANVTNVQQSTFKPSIPILPRMYFSNSHVTINYNFNNQK